MRAICRDTAVGLVLLSVVLVGCSPASGRPPVAGAGGANTQRPTKHLTAVIRGEPYTLSEAINAAGSGSVPGVAELQELIHAGLAVEDDSRNLRPRLAEDVPGVTNGQWIVQADGRMRTTWKLKPGVVWQDGTPFTSSDLVFSTEVARDKQVALAADTAFGIIDHVEAPDATTFVVYWVKPFVNADRLFTRAGGSRVLPMPRHLLESDFREDPSTLSQVSYWTHDFVGLGPYQVKEFVESSHLILQASDSYVLGRPHIDEIEVKFMPDPSTIAANIVAGAVEFTLGGRYSLEWGIQVRDQWRDGRMEAPVASTWVALFPQFLNPTPAVLSDLQFRQALLSAINRQEMSDTIQAGLSPVADSIIAPGEPEYSDVESRIVRYSFDTRRAASQIEDLGFTKGVDGVYADGSGRKLNIEIRTRQGDDLQEKTLFGVAGYWQQLGLGVDPLIFPPQRAPDREFRATRPAFEVVRQPSGVDALARYHSGSTPLPENGYRGLNRTRYQNPSFDALIEKYLTTIPKKERNDTVGEIVNYMSGQVLVLGIYWALDPVMISNRLTNVSNQNTTWNANEWDVRT
jgi:peptide/nickel transport system substrate-binding protein